MLVLTICLWHCTSTVPQQTIVKTLRFTKQRKAEIYQRLLNLFLEPIRLSDAEEKFEQFAMDEGLTNTARQDIKAQLFHEGLVEIKLKWPNKRSTSKIYISKNQQDINALEVAKAFYKKSYLCYMTALYWNDLTEQVPQVLFVAHERPNPPFNTDEIEFNDIDLRDAFVKAPLEHTKTATIKNYQLIFLDRAFTDFLGVKTISVPFQGKEVQINITGLERTLLDCVSSPENAGGIANVIDAFERSLDRINLKKLIEIYQNLNFKYPHWQRVGFIFDKLGKSDLANQWRKSFDKPKNKFFLMKEYRLDWEFDPKWNLYYPKGLFK